MLSLAPFYQPQSTSSNFSTAASWLNWRAELPRRRPARPNLPPPPDGPCLPPSQPRLRLERCPQKSHQLNATQALTNDVYPRAKTPKPGPGKDPSHAALLDGNRLPTSREDLPTMIYSSHRHCEAVPRRGVHAHPTANEPTQKTLLENHRFSGHHS
jgi:hypothetical protein